jgi:ABC-type Fe3+ transport system substrate-binding protein
MAPHTDAISEFLKLNAPIDLVVVKEGAFISPGNGAIGIPQKLAHPNAGKIFLNWLLTKEGQTVFSQSFGYASLRVDVSTEWVPALLLPLPGEKLFLDSEENILFRGKMLNIAKEVIQEASKK